MPDVSSVYRLQLHAGFDFGSAAAIAPYLRRLGVSHLYCSPYLQAVPGSTHGYDVIDHGMVNTDLGGAEGLAALDRALRDNGLGQVLDIVPNHMAVAGRDNPWWWDVLENGPASRYAHYFDIDWDPPEHKLAATVLVPVLGDHYGRVLEAGELVLHRVDGSFVVRYHEHEVPVSPRSLDDLLAEAAATSASDDLAFLARAHARLPAATATAPAALTERHHDKEILRRQLDRLCRDQPTVAAAIDAEVARVNADPDRLDALLARQNYRLAYWRTAGRELDYRRFFDINTLVALRVEDPEVFAATHATVRDLLRQRVVDGLRIDHIDGLRDPGGYLERVVDELGPGYLVVEKILEGDEQLPDTWPVAGTTGYDFLNHVNRLLVDPAAEAAMTSIYEDSVGGAVSWHDIEGEAKHLVLHTVLAADVERLTARLSVVCEGRRRSRDFTRDELRDAVREVAAAFPVYRTYVQPGQPLRPLDRGIVAGAVVEAAQRRADLDPELLEFLGRILVMDVGGEAESDLALRFQQLTGPVMAKAVEDTAFYRYVRLASLNEVGGDPARFGSDVAAFHDAMGHAAQHWPSAMLTLSTHDTKRSADVRARLAALSEVPEAWAEAVRALSKLSGRHRVDDLPSANDQYLLWQILVGAWPIDADRVAAYMEKATREAKLHTSWTDPDPVYDQAVQRLARGVAADPAAAAVIEELLQQHRVADAGVVNSLAQTTLLLTAPGVPDIYRGTETFELSLVDPDNRRPVDHAALDDLLGSLDGLEAESAARRGPGELKLWLVSRLLDARRGQPGLRPGAGYEPRELEGALATRAVCFGRGDDVVVIVPCRGHAALSGWGATSCELPAGSWRSVLTGAEHQGGRQRVESLAGPLPVAVLVRG